MATPDEQAELRLKLERARLTALTEWKTFLEATPPNVAVKIPHLFELHHPNSQSRPWSVLAVGLELHCERDGGSRWFSAGNDYVYASNRREFIEYTCNNCGHGKKLFALFVQQDPKHLPSAEVMKLGEFPPFGAPVSRRVSKLLGDEDLELYRKGMRAEAQGLGIGAASYFRRVVENQWRQLVAEMRTAAEKLGAADLSLFDRAAAEHSFSAAVKMLKDGIPEKLQILDGQNPLTLLHQPLSVQLHGLSDEECLQQAADIRLVLTALLENIADVMKERDELKAAAARLGRPRT